MRFNKIKADIKKLPESKQQAAQAILDKAIWQEAQLAFLQEHINENGWVEDYRNGEHQSGRKKSAEADTYLSLAKIFTQTMKQLLDVLSSVVDYSDDDELTAFLKGSAKKMSTR